MCFLDKVGNFTAAGCGQCLLAFIGYVDLVGVDNYPATVDAITDFCIDGLGPPELLISGQARKLEASNVCSGTETDLETVSLTILEIFNGSFPTEAIVPPYTPAPTAAPSAAPTVTTGTTTTGTTTTGTTTGTSSAVHLSIGSWTLLLAFVGIWA